MAADGKTGVDGEVKLGATVIGNLDMWKITVKGKTERVSGFGSKWATKKPSLLDGSGEASGIWSSGDGGGQGAILAALAAQTKVTLTLAVDRLDPDPWVVDAYLSDAEEGSKLDGTSDFKFSFEFAGEPTSIPTHA